MFKNYFEMYNKEDIGILLAPSAVQHLRAAKVNTFSCKQGHVHALVQVCSVVLDRTKHNPSLHAPTTEMRAEHHLHK